MPHPAGGVSVEAIARKWHALAERQLLYYGELYVSGRWALFFATRERFARHMLNVITAARIWARLAGVTRTADGDRGKDDLKSAA